MLENESTLKKEPHFGKVKSQGHAGLEAAFQVPMPGDSGSSPDTDSISNYYLTQKIFTPTPADCCLKQVIGK